MVKIALISEGITDQLIIKPIVENYFKDIDFKFRPITPITDETDKQIGFGSWTNVINSCREENFEEIFIYNDLVIIQIDTDVAHLKGFDVAAVQKGKTIENEDLCSKTIKKLQNIIPEKVFEKYAERFIFAIGILTIECWLLPILNPKQVKKETNNCLFKLNKSLLKKNKEKINPDNKNNSLGKSIYKELAGKFKNKSIIEKYSKYNIGFEVFVNQLDKIRIENYSN